MELCLLFVRFKPRFTVEAIFNRLSHIKCAKFYMGYVAYPMLFVVGMYAECLLSLLSTVGYAAEKGQRYDLYSWPSFRG